MSKEKKIHIVKSVIKHGLLLCVGFFWIYPFLWMISASFKGQNEFFQNRMGLIPVQPTIDNFIRIWQKADFGTYFINTIIVTAFSVIIVLIMTMMAGYAMGRYKFLGRNLCMAVFLASIAIPLVSTIIPTYEVVKRNESGRYQAWIDLITGRRSACYLFASVYQFLSICTK